MPPASVARSGRDALGALLGGAARRLMLLAAIEGAAIGFATAAILGLAGWPTRSSSFTPLVAGLLAALVGASARAWTARRRRHEVARSVERAAPQSRNIIFTALELAATAPTAPAESRASYVHEVVFARAAELAERLDPAALFPVGRRGLLLLVTAVIWVSTIAVATGGALLGPPASATPTIDRVDVVITPPSYVGGSARTERNPDRISVLAGSRVELRVRTNAPVVRMETLDSTAMLLATAGELSTTFVPRGDGLVTVTPVDAALAGIPAGDSRLIGITVTPDAAPTVRIVAPAKDMLVPDGRRTLDVGIEASDDIGLATLTLKYTKVTGSGERFTFKDAEVPIDIRRRDAREWTASQKWALNSLALEPGDMLVYRAIARDARPGALPVESDAFIVEIVTPGGIAEAGYSVDPDEERTAISQQMVVLKTQRLIARRAAIPADSLLPQSQEIAAEQRRVRAEFVFLMGGEMSDAGANDSSMTEIEETEDAAAEEDLMAGRQLNQGRIALLRAIRAMSLAARSLNEADLTTALGHEREAVKQLELAFSRNRILLRAFSQREALDTTRRLSGDMSDLARGTRTSLPPDSSVRAASLRRVAQMIVRELPVYRARAIAAAAEAALRADPSSKAVQGIASDLTEASRAFERGQDAAGQAALDRATLALNAELAAPLPSLGGQRGTVQSRAARGALSDLLRRRP